MAKKKQLPREEAAAIEVGHTEINKQAAKVFSIFFTAWLAIIPATHFISNSETIKSIFPMIAAAFKTDSLPKFNDSLKSGFHRFEDSLNETSPIREAFLEPLQLFLLQVLKTGNEKVIVGKDGYLFYPEDIDYLLEPGFMRPARLWKRQQSGVQPNPLKAISDFNQQLKSRNIRLIVVPIPVKAAFYGDKLCASADYLENKNYLEFLSSLDKSGIEYADLRTEFQSLRNTGVEPFLKTDTHWTPEAMAAAVKKTAGMLNFKLSKISATPQEICNRGDTAALLKLAKNPFPKEKVTIHQYDFTPDRTSDVLVLGDSFVNIYSLGAMGWGVRGGFSEHLAATLGKPIDVIARNDGGDYASRLILSGEMARGRDRLAGKKTVIWVFSARKLPSGDWKLLDMTLGQTPEKKFLNVTAPQEVTATVLGVSPVPRPHTAPYKDHIMSLHLGDINGGTEQALVYCVSMRDNCWTAAANLRLGDSIKIRVEPWEKREAEYGSWNRSEFEEEELTLQEPLWGELK